MRYSPVLTSLDLPVAELSALRLDGEAFALDEAVIAVDEPELAVNRAAALAGLFTPRMVVELDTALWVYGCLSRPPAVHTGSIRRDTRGRLLSTTRLTLRETTVPEEEIVSLAGIRITTRGRTAVDVALLDAVPPERGAAVRELCGSAQVAAEALTIALQLGHTPGKLRAIDRLREWSVGRPPDPATATPRRVRRVAQHWPLSGDSPVGCRADNADRAALDRGAG
ncbi:hypothetical protein [Gryllotalpicola koreensis]|uniref:AbiEi antitoxin C-terminal domain-containing protein n=1 Tax=Gryllotalpicola koreensis TaxID=993086 RepID=A0ABP7ZX35_9MICO